MLRRCERHTTAASDVFIHPSSSSFSTITMAPGRRDDVASCHAAGADGLKSRNGEIKTDPPQPQLGMVASPSMRCACSPVSLLSGTIPTTNTKANNISPRNTSWVKCESRSHAGKFYWFNQSTGKSQWKPPRSETPKKKNALRTTDVASALASRAKRHDKTNKQNAEQGPVEQNSCGEVLKASSSQDDAKANRVDSRPAAIFTERRMPAKLVPSSTSSYALLQPKCPSSKITGDLQDRGHHRQSLKARWHSSYKTGGSAESRAPSRSRDQLSQGGIVLEEGGDMKHLRDDFLQDQKEKECTQIRKLATTAEASGVKSASFADESSSRLTTAVETSYSSRNSLNESNGNADNEVWPSTIIGGKKKRSVSPMIARRLATWRGNANSSSNGNVSDPALQHRTKLLQSRRGKGGVNSYINEHNWTRRSGSVPVRGRSGQYTRVLWEQRNPGRGEESVSFMFQHRGTEKVVVSDPLLPAESAFGAAKQQEHVAVLESDRSDGDSDSCSRNSTYSANKLPRGSIENTVTSVASSEENDSCLTNRASVLIVELPFAKDEFGRIPTPTDEKPMVLKSRFVRKPSAAVAAMKFVDDENHQLKSAPVLTTGTSAFGRASAFALKWRQAPVTSPSKLSDVATFNEASITVLKEPCSVNRGGLTVKGSDISSKSEPERKVSYKRSSSPMAERLALWRNKAATNIDSNSGTESKKRPLHASRSRSASAGGALMARTNQIKNIDRDSEANASVSSFSSSLSSWDADSVPQLPLKVRSASPMAERLAVWKKKSAGNSNDNGNFQENITNSDNGKRNKRRDQSPAMMERLQKWRVVTSASAKSKAVSSHPLQISSKYASSPSVRNLHTVLRPPEPPSLSTSSFTPTSLNQPSPALSPPTGRACRRSMSPLIAARMKKWQNRTSP